ncbi:MAG TPA: peptide deformylase [candidate division WOR-3 bacterium]|uniref:Peptide deformylase n=1 Tax=candidate division WOR-3 bacterium TaxID=2052148 RepID=A0A7V5HMQ4_UNCW3|nr:peptide deformylase [candidate division WOR-3 bacterium]
MSIRRIRIIGDPVLRTPAEEVKEVTEELIELRQDLIDTMLEANGLGLAANQIGVLKKVVVINVEEIGVGKGIKVLVNPVVIFVEGTQNGEEGCLSIPGLYAELERPYFVKVEALEFKGKKLKPVTIEAEALYARALLHEIDHLNGILFVDRMEKERRRILLARWHEERKRSLL